MSDHPDTLSAAVRIEHAATLGPLHDIPEALLVRALAANIDAAREPTAVTALSKEFRAASEALREAVARAGKRGDAVDDLASKRTARRSAGASDTRRTGQRKQ